MSYVLGVNKLLVDIENLSNKDVSDALVKSCIIVESSAKQKCPVQTGQLRSSISFYVDGNTGYVGSNAEYAPYVEFGTGIKSSLGNGRKTPWRYMTADGQWYTTTGQEAQPFLQPALIENEGKILQIFKDELKGDK